MKILRILALAGTLTCSMFAGAFASQNSTTLPTTSPYPGLTMLGNINSAFNTFQTNFSGSSAPSGATSTQWWADTSTSLLKFTPDGTNWYPVGNFSSGWTASSSGFKQLAVTSTGSSNHYIVTYSPAPTAYVVGQAYHFITNFQNTGAADVNFNSLGVLPLTKQGGSSLVANDIGSSVAVDCVYDGTNCQVTSQLSQASTGTVTSISTNNGVTGGPISSSGTIGLAAISAGTFLANTSGSSAVPTATSLSSVGLPAGGAMIWHTTSCPAGYLEENGSAVSRTTYAVLFSIIGTTFGAGNGSTTFNLPDTRGYFVRGWDDGAGVDPGRSFASTQTDAFQGHQFQYTYPDFISALVPGGGAQAYNLTSHSLTTTGPISDGTHGTPRVASETRPINIALMYCIKY